MPNQNQNQNNSLILNLESSTKEYDILLIQYNKVQSDYINYLQQNPGTIQKGSGQPRQNVDLSKVSNSAFWGSLGISSSNVSSVEKCSALCSQTPGCTGATYNVTNTGQNNCWLRSGDGMVISGTGDQIAIIPKAKEYLLTLQTLNTQLIHANDKIIKIFLQYETFSKQDDERKEKYKLLKQNYANLEMQRINILQQLQEQQTIQEKQTQGQLVVTKNYYNYILLLFIVIVCLLILGNTVIGAVNQSGSSGNNSNSLAGYFAILTFLVLIFIISYFYNKIFR
jgi:hypothetical protein